MEYGVEEDYWILFIDLANAYPSVDLEIMW